MDLTPTNLNKLSQMDNEEVKEFEFDDTNGYSEVWLIKAMEMSEEEFENLGEHEGW